MNDPFHYTYHQYNKINQVNKLLKRWYSLYNDILIVDLFEDDPILDIQRFIGLNPINLQLKHLHKTI
ncbi:MAG TPA: hypothetical protein DHN29_11130 [Cytophagales bacterium]|nr:hypothetical protein [Cytophagales bacterium]